jgi:hypothetical protein
MITLVPQCVKYSMTDKQRDALTLLIESIHKPDSKLRGCAHNQGCYDELMEWREKVITMLKDHEKSGICI